MAGLHPQPSALANSNPPPTANATIALITPHLLSGLLGLDQAGAAAILFNLSVGALAVIGAVCATGFLVEAQGTDRYVDGQMRTHGTLPERIFLLLFVAALIGAPPFPSFLGKFMLVGMTIREGWHWVGFSTILAGVISLVALCRLSFGLVGAADQAPAAAREGTDTHAALMRRILLISVLLPVVFLTAYAQTVLNWADRSVRVIFW